MPTRKEKKTPVTREFLMNLADTIYNPKTKRFLRLCEGILQNGPDPTNPRRPMHCGLGELYYAMTGLQPEETDVDEDGVVQMALARSPLKSGEETRIEAENAIEELDLPQEVKDRLLYALNDIDEDYFMTVKAQNFKEALENIPEENDSVCEEDEDRCSNAVFRERSERVAAQLRKAASFLPRTRK